MAREHARILTRIWSDADFCALPIADQRLYFQLLSQKNLSQAGVLPLQIRKLAKGSAETTEDDVVATLKRLEAARFVFVDADTEEVLIRSFIRNDGVMKIPNVFKAALRAATTVESPLLREVLAEELRRTRRKDAIAVADELSPKELERVPEPISNLSGTNSEPLKVRDEIPEPQGEGEGEGEGESFVGGDFKEDVRERRQVADDRPDSWQSPPSRCPEHRNTEKPPPCGKCATARQARERWDADQGRAAAERRTADARQRATDRARAIAACDLCDDDGQIGRQLCDHDPDAANRAARGRAAVQAALAARTQDGPP
ncbi:hypothetical protein SD37_11570 [Amycolatopsis orientalis]|uniref:Uncharacterized protein n=1 Tax=Amycolatopsis orientalis TaxID=31958 RepID=A0A193BVF9_AMYOR|nr:hypothetical protein [Amycolatopsis orientalis]ANN16216.1 hypothetical protein SD37_11570 [Amycolatopsis orientalis]